MPDDTPVNFNERRALKAEDNRLWSSKDCATAFMRDLDNGEIKPTRVIILYEEDADDGGTYIRQYSSNVPHDALISMLWVKLFKETQKWLR